MQLSVTLVRRAEEVVDEATLEACEPGQRKDSSFSLCFLSTGARYLRRGIASPGLKTEESLRLEIVVRDVGEDVELEEVEEREKTALTL